MKLDEIYEKYKNGEIPADEMVKILLQFIEQKNSYLDTIRKNIPSLDSTDEILEIIDYAMEDEL